MRVQFVLLVLTHVKIHQWKLVHSRLGCVKGLLHREDFQRDLSSEILGSSLRKSELLFASSLCTKMPWLGLGCPRNKQK
jgi:hypothetical protein